MRTTQEDFWRSIPQCHDFMRVVSEGDAKRSSQAEIGKFDVALQVEEEVLWLEVSMHDAIRVAIRNASIMTMRCNENC